MTYSIDSSISCIYSFCFRAYLSRKPGGLILVTVQSTQLPRPLFRSYPLDIGEAVAVERATSHALVVVLKSEHARVKLGVHHPMMPPHADKQGPNECDCQPAQYRGEVKSVFQHGSPHGLHQPREHAAVRSEEQAGVDGCAVNGGHLALHSVNDCISEIHAPHSKVESPNPCMLGAAVDRRRTEHQHAEQNPQPTQHLRLRVVWQGLL